MISPTSADITDCNRFTEDTDVILSRTGRFVWPVVGATVSLKADFKSRRVALTREGEECL